MVGSSSSSSRYVLGWRLFGLNASTGKEGWGIAATAMVYLYTLHFPCHLSLTHWVRRQLWVLHPESSQRTLEEIGLILAADSPWVWTAGSNFHMLKEANPAFELAKATSSEYDADNAQLERSVRAQEQVETCESSPKPPALGRSESSLERSLATSLDGASFPSRFAEGSKSRAPQREDDFQRRLLVEYLPGANIGRKRLAPQAGLTG
ncbi:uncharacterized protein BJX67DRAFT_376408 [Aspergillus lucknowensis]|uniref:Uncharacterized protein n=1 Tax=Aspergillus lucknowensis TaxID=176173 RepID=A0ABR4M7U2_9EURO